MRGGVKGGRCGGMEGSTGHPQGKGKGDYRGIEDGGDRVREIRTQSPLPSFV